MVVWISEGGVPKALVGVEMGREVMNESSEL